MLTLNVRVPKGIWACNFGVKFVHIKYESSQNLVLIEHRKDAPRQRMTARQNDVYPRKIENVLKCTIEGDMVSALHNP